MKNITEYEAYFKDMAVKHADIIHDDESNKHFYLADISEILTELRSGFSDYVVIVESYEGYGSDNRSSFLSKEKTGAFMLLKNVSSRSKVNMDKNAALTWTEEVGWQFIAKMYNDSITIGHTFYGLFDLNTVNFQKVGPLYDDYYGWRFEFSWTDKQNIRYDATKWNL